MGKKNKKQNISNGAKSPDKTKPQGGSAIAKGKPQKIVAPNKPKEISPKKAGKPNQKPDTKPINKNLEKSKKIPDEKLKAAAAVVAEKSKKKRKNKKKPAATNGDVAKVEDASKAAEKTDDGGPVILTKRLKSRLKSEINKEIILKGKSKLGLADPKLVVKKLAKLKRKPEPHSKKVQGKILLFESLLKKLSKGKKVDIKKETENISEDSDSSDDDGDEKMSDGENKPKKANGKSVTATPQKPKRVEYTVFVGGLPEGVTKEIVIEHFKPAGVVIKAKVPAPKKKKSNKRFAYVQMIDEPARQKALQLHGTTLMEKKITVLYADKSKGKKEIMSINAKLNALRKSEGEKATEGEKASDGDTPKEKTKKNKTKKTNKKSPFFK